MLLPNRNLEWPISYDGVVEIAISEGCRLKAYRCPAGIPTIGWGHTKGVRMTDVITQEQADQYLLEDLDIFASEVVLVAFDCNNNELSALVSLAFNIGLAGFKRSTVLREHNKGNHQAAARAFALWNKATVNGKLVALSGLTARRARESSIYLTPDFDTLNTTEPDYLPMPQEVQGESNMAKSPIMQGGVGTVALGVVATMSEVVEPVNTFATNLNLNPVLILGAIAIITGIIVITQRLKQRKEGWA